MSTRRALRETPGGVQIALRAQPRASRDAVVGLLGDRVKIAVTAAPEGGKANAAIERTLAKALGLRPSAVAIVAGRTARDKAALVQGLTVKEVEGRLEVAIKGQGEGVRSKTQDVKRKT